MIKEEEIKNLPLVPPFSRYVIAHAAGSVTQSRVGSRFNVLVRQLLSNVEHVIVERDGPLKVAPEVM